MISRFFAANLPPPTEEQLTTSLKSLTLSIKTQVVSIAYEPRFQLIALGTASGELHVINSSGDCFVSDQSTYSPICKLFSLPNTSTFLSACSRYLVDNHPFRKYEYKGSESFDLLQNSEFRKVPSIISHWVVHQDSIELRATTISFNIVDIAIPPDYPNFALILTDKGSIYGFSIEELSFTKLYVDSFEGLNPRSIFSSGDTKFYITLNDKIEEVNLQTMVNKDYCSISSKSFDIINYTASVTTDEGLPCKIYGNKILQKLDVQNDSTVIYTGMITENDWITIVHTKMGDKVYINNMEKLSLGKDELIVPGVLICYKNFFQRTEPKFVAIVTHTGKIMYLDTTLNPDIHFYTELFDPKKAFLDGNHLYIFSDKKILDFKDYKFYRCYDNKAGIPLHVKNGQMLITQNDPMYLNVVNITNQAKQPMIKLDFELINYSRPILTFCCKGNILIFIDLSQDSFFYESSQSYYPPEGTIMWRDYGTDQKITISVKNHLILGNADKEICGMNENIILFEVINEQGKVTNQGNYILIVTNENIFIFVPNDTKFKKLKCIQMNGIVNAMVTEWGSLILQLHDTIQIIPLPDISQKRIACLSLENEVKIVFIPFKGFLMFEKEQIYLYLPEKDIQKRTIFENKPQIEKPKINSFMKFFGSKEITMKDMDSAFQYQRMKKVDSKLSELEENMQQLLVNAQKRGEQLNDLEAKANNLANISHKYYKISKEFHE